MLEEEKKLIEALELEIQRLEKITTGPTGTYAPLETLVMISNLIKSQQEKIEKNKRLFSIQEKRKLQLLQRKDKEIEKKDKIIDLILEEIAFDYEINSSEDVVTIKRQLKEKFEKKVEDKQC